MRWADFGFAVQDAIDMFAVVYASCEIQKVFNTVGGIVSPEGASALVARVSAGMIYEIPYLWAQWNKCRLAYCNGIIAGQFF